MRVASIAVLLIAAVAAAIAANFVLLGYGGDQNDRVGNLTPGIVDAQAGGGQTVGPRPPATTTVGSDEADDDPSGQGVSGTDEDD
jgi:hypothetical protein